MTLSNFIHDFLNSFFASSYIKVLLCFILLDVFLGITRAFITKKLNSNIGIRGLIKHTTVIILVLTAKWILTFIDMGSVGKIIVIFYIAEYGLSIIENLNLIGVPFPEFLVERLKYIRGESNKGDYKHEIKGIDK